MNAPLVVSIGMTHPQNVAGLGVDVRVAADYGVRHAMVVAAVSAQDEEGVHAVFSLPWDVVQDQIRTAQLSEAAAVRVGAMGTAKNLGSLERCLIDKRVVIDPVMRSSTGGSLYEDDPASVLQGFGGASSGTVITPNVEEAQQLTGIAIRGVDDMAAAGKVFLERGIDAALIKGGHLAGDPTDVLVARDGAQAFTDTRLPRTMRGTGCTLAMALACELALGHDLLEAVRGARAYVRAKMARL